MTLTRAPEEKVAIVLRLLGQPVTDTVLRQLPAEQSQQLQQVLHQFEQQPPPEADIEEVLDDFERFFRFAAATGGMPTTKPAEDQEADEPPPRPRPKRKERPQLRLVGNPFEDLYELRSYQIFGALRSENPRTVALVLNCLEPAVAGEVLQMFPEEQRGELAVQLADHPTAPDSLLERLVRTTVEKGSKLDKQAIANADEEAVRKLAGMLRNMNRADRGQIMNTLEEQKPETAAAIKKQLYVFTDLLDVTDRSLQRLLAEVDSSTLAIALKGSDEALMEKVMNNLSRRAREALTEEIEFQGSVTAEAQAEARTSICQVMANLDQQGELVMM